MTLHKFTREVIHCGDTAAPYYVCHSRKPVFIAIKDTMLRALLGKLPNNECGHC